MCNLRNSAPAVPEPAPRALPVLPFASVGGAALSAALVAYILDFSTPIDINRGAYAIAVAVFVVASGGCLASYAERRIRQHVTSEINRASDELADRLEQVIRHTPPTVTYLPGRARIDHPRTVAVGGEGDTVGMPTGLDPDTVAAVRSINRRLNGNGQQNSQQN